MFTPCCDEFKEEIRLIGNGYLGSPNAFDWDDEKQQWDVIADDMWVALSDIKFCPFCGAQLEKPEHKMEKSR